MFALVVDKRYGVVVMQDGHIDEDTFYVATSEDGLKLLL